MIKNVIVIQVILNILAVVIYNVLAIQDTRLELVAVTKNVLV